MLINIEAQARERYICGFNVACLDASLGDHEEAFTWLEKAYRDRSGLNAFCRGGSPTRPAARGCAF
jgi:hypothetical protein